MTYNARSRNAPVPRDQGRWILTAIVAAVPLFWLGTIVGEAL